MRKWPVVVIFIVQALLILGFWRFGAAVLSPPDVLPLADPSSWRLADRAAATSQSLDQALTFLTSLAFGLVVLLGFILRPGDQGSTILHGWSEAAAAVAFVVLITLSLFFAYGARLRAFEVLASGSVDFSSARDIVTNQGLCLALATLPAFYLLSRAMFSGQPRGEI
tara:strand:+ start:2578 stop:3078 length:501 start_codon:yes stop_codon:yes gene_type:complete